MKKIKSIDISFSFGRKAMRYFYEGDTVMAQALPSIDFPNGGDTIISFHTMDQVFEAASNSEHLGWKVDSVEYFDEETVDA